METRTCPFLAVWPPESRNAPRCPVPTGLSLPAPSSPRVPLDSSPPGDPGHRGECAHGAHAHAQGYSPARPPSSAPGVALHRHRHRLRVHQTEVRPCVQHALARSSGALAGSLSSRNRRAVRPPEGGDTAPRRTEATLGGRAPDTQRSRQAVLSRGPGLAGGPRRGRGSSCATAAPWPVSAGTARKSPPGPVRTRLRPPCGGTAAGPRPDARPEKTAAPSSGA